MLTHTKGSSFIFKGKILMKEEGVLEYFAERWHWSHLPLCQNANRETHSHTPTSTSKHLVIKTTATLLSTHLLQSGSYFSFFNKTKYFALVLTSIVSSVCLKKWGKMIFFLQPKHHQLPATQNWGNEMGMLGRGEWNFCGALLRSPSSPDRTFCQFPICRLWARTRKKSQLSRCSLKTPLLTWRR